MAYTGINKSTDYFNTVTYTGNGGTQSIASVGHQPDWTWIKVRDTTYAHYLFDAVRGATKQIQANNTNPETTSANQLTAFTSNGFNLSSDVVTNGNNDEFVAWNWKANGQGSSNTDGSINTTYTSANTTAGFSIVKYTGNGTNNATFGHGLGVAPKLCIGKCLGNNNNWQVTGNAGVLTEGKYFSFNEPDAMGTSSNVSFDASATTIKLQGGQGTNASGQPHIAYCFAEKTGFSKIGGYVGNGNADGAFVYCGFRPAWVIIKPANAAQNWQIHDTKRDGYNPKNDNLSSNNTNTEADNKFIDIVSNGFKLRRSDVLNVSGDNYIFMAFAEAPLVGTNDVTAKAR